MQTAQAWSHHFFTHWDNTIIWRDLTKHPIRLLHFTWQVCQTLELSQGNQVLTTDAQLIQTYLTTHPNPSVQTRYL